MSSQTEELGVVLPAAPSRASPLQRLLQQATSEHPQAFSLLSIPEHPKEFRKVYPRLLVRFEAARQKSPARLDIANTMLKALHDSMGFHTGQERLSLSEALHYRRAGESPVTFRRLAFQHAGPWTPSVSLAGQHYESTQVLNLVEQLHADGHMTEAARQAFHWLVQQSQSQHGGLALRDKAFVLLGAGAELAPTEMLLRAGAKVLWLDPREPPEALRQGSGLSGELFVPSQPVDLLSDPAYARAAILAFQAELRVPALHFGLFAYAPGKGRELKLTATMDALLRSLPPALVASVGMYVSPTVPARVHPQELHHAVARTHTSPWWQQGLARMGALDPSGHFRPDRDEPLAIAEALVSLQGPHYQAAQYVTKLLSAELFACRGLALTDSQPPAPIPTSANIAGITATRSLQHPIFQAAFLGAPAFGVRIFEPATTRATAGLLWLHDLLQPSHAETRSDAERLAELHARQVHGGIYNMPWLFESSIRIATVMGLAMKPMLIKGLLRRGTKRPRRAS